MILRIVAIFHSPSTLHATSKFKCLFTVIKNESYFTSHKKTTSLRNYVLPKLRQIKKILHL